MDLQTSYLGLSLRSPIVVGAGPYTYHESNFKKIEDTGVGAIVMHSLFEEQVRKEMEDLDYYTSYGTDSFAEALSYFPDLDSYQTSADQYLKILEKVAKTIEIPIIGSLNGISAKGWTQYAKRIEDAGASAIELNIYYLPLDPNLSGSDVENRYLDVVRAVRESVSIPVAVKIGPYFSSMLWMAKRFAEAGVNGLVLFNRFYQPDINLEQLEVECKLELSSPIEIRLPLLWIAAISAQLPELSLAATSGVQTGNEVVKYLLAGAHVVMITSAMLREGIQVLNRIHQQMETLLSTKGYQSVSQVIGVMNRRKVADPTAYERANYIKILKSVRM